MTSHKDLTSKDIKAAAGATPAVEVVAAAAAACGAPVGSLIKTEKLQVTGNAEITGTLRVHKIKGFSPIEFDDPVICNQSFTTVQATTLNDARFTTVGLQTTVNDDGGADPLPSNPAGYAKFYIDGVPIYFPYYNPPTPALLAAKSASKKK